VIGVDKDQDGADDQPQGGLRGVGSGAGEEFHPGNPYGGQMCGGHHGIECSIQAIRVARCVLLGGSSATALARPVFRILPGSDVIDLRRNNEFCGRSMPHLKVEHTMSHGS
jgi:hypothetical protein